MNLLKASHFTIAAMFLATPVLAQAHEDNHEKGSGKIAEHWKAADKNSDGKLSKEEAAALPRLATHFDEIDTDKDGFVTSAELHATMKNRHGQHAMQHLDKNGDGLISREETIAKPRLVQHFDELDTNKDGSLSKDELKAGHRKVRQARFAKIDQNNDGHISLPEAESSAPMLAKHFTTIDTNGDGFLTPEELQAAHRNHHPKN